MDIRAIISELQAVVGDDYVIYKPEDLIVFEYDGSVDKALPNGRGAAQLDRRGLRVRQGCRKAQCPNRGPWGRHRP